MRTRFSPRPQRLPRRVLRPLRTPDVRRYTGQSDLRTHQFTCSSAEPLGRSVAARQPRWDVSAGVPGPYLGGKELDKHERMRLNMGGGSGGKAAAVVGIKDWETNQVVATPMKSVTARNVEVYASEFLDDTGVTVYNDESRAYSRIGNRESVNHSAGEYGRDKAHTNGIESF